MTNKKNLLILVIVKKLVFIISALVAYPLLALPVYAIGADPCTGGNPIMDSLCKLTGDNIGIIIQNVVVFIIVIAVIIALIYLLYGGIKWVTSKGEKTEVEAARNHITAAITGLIIVFLAIFIITIILSFFGLHITNLQLPSLLQNQTI